MGRRTYLAGSLITCWVLVSACGGGGGLAEADPTSDLVGSSVLVLSTSSGEKGSDRGGLVFFDGEGRASELRTARLEGAELVWADGLLHFSDGEHEHTLGPGEPTTLEHGERRTAQHRLHLLPDGSRLSLYNEGTMVISRAGDTGMRERRFDDFVTDSTVCGDRVLALVPVDLMDDVGPVDLVDLSHDEPRVLHRADTVPSVYETMRCVGEDVYFLGDGPRADDRVVVRWDLETGEVDSAPLVGGFGEETRWTDGRAPATLVGVDLAGQYWRVDLASATAESVAHTGVDHPDNFSVRIDADDDTLYVLDLDDPRHGVLRALDLDTGAVTGELELGPVVGDLNDEGLDVWDVAVLTSVHDWPRTQSDGD